MQIMPALIDHLSLAPNQSSLTLLSKIQHYSFKSFKIYYLQLSPTDFLLISTHNYFKTLSQPNTLHLAHFPSLLSLQSFVANL